MFWQLESWLEGGVRLRLDSGKCNEVGSVVLAELSDILSSLSERIEGGEVIRCLVIYSRKLSPKGTSCFCAGADIKERRLWSVDRLRKHIIFQRGVMESLRQLGCFTIALIDGASLGLGIELSAVCDYRIATRRSFFGFPEVKLGVIPGAGGCVMLSRMSKGVGFRFGLTGEVMGVFEAEGCGLVDMVCEDIEAGWLECERILKSLNGVDYRAQRKLKEVLLSCHECCGKLSEIEQSGYFSLLKEKHPFS